MSGLELFGVILALIYVVLAIIESPLCWLFAIASSAFYIIIFFQAELYTESFLQLFFILLAFQGIRRWKGAEDQQVAQVKQMPLVLHFKLITCSLLVSVLLGGLIHWNFSLPSAFADAAITVFSVTTTYLVTEKYLENWIYWMIIDVVAAALYFFKALYLTSGLYLLYVLLAYIGYRKWKNQKQIEI